MCVYAMAWMWRSENSIQELFLCVHPIDSKDEIQVVKLGSQYFNLLNQRISPIKCFSNEF